MTLENRASQQVAPSELAVQQQNPYDTTPLAAVQGAVPATPEEHLPPAPAVPVEPAAPAELAAPVEPAAPVVSNEPAPQAAPVEPAAQPTPTEQSTSDSPVEDVASATPAEPAAPVAAVEQAAAAAPAVAAPPAVPAEDLAPLPSSEDAVPAAPVDPQAPISAPATPIEYTVEAEAVGEADTEPSVDIPVGTEAVDDTPSAATPEAAAASPVGQSVEAEVAEDVSPAAVVAEAASAEPVEPLAETGPVEEAPLVSTEEATPAEHSAEAEAVEETAPAAVVEEVAPATPAEPSAGASPVYDDATVRSLMDMLIMTDGMIQPQERAFAIDLLQQVIIHASNDSKRVLCERLANMEDAPERLVSLFLQHTEIAIAAPLLHRANCVSDSELMVVVEAGDSQRCRLIAGRPQLSGVIASALSKSSDASVLQALARNKSVHLAQEAIDQLTVHACTIEDLVEPLVMRPEMTTAHALYLFWSMGAKHRAYTLGRFLTDIRVLPHALVMSGSSGDLALGGGEAGSGDSQPALAARPDREKASELLAAMDLGETESVATLISEYAGLAPETADRISKDEGGEAHVVVCKALGASRFAFADICQRQIEAGAPPASVEALQILFDTLSFNQARMALTYWDWFSNKLGPYANFPGRDVTSAQETS